LNQLLLSPTVLKAHNARLESFITTVDPTIQPAILFVRPEPSGEDILERARITGLSPLSSADAAYLTTTKPRPRLHPHVRQQIKIQNLGVDIPLLMIKDLSLLPTALLNLAREARYPSRLPIRPDANNIGRSLVSTYFVHHITFASVPELSESLRDVAGRDIENAGMRLMADLGVSKQESEQILREMMSSFKVH
jgi:hypothetical protein